MNNMGVFGDAEPKASSLVKGRVAFHCQLRSCVRGTAARTTTLLFPTCRHLSPRTENVSSSQVACVSQFYLGIVEDDEGGVCR